MPVPPLGHNRLAAIIDDLAARGWTHQPALLPSDMTAALRADLAGLAAEKALTLGGVGREDKFALDRDVRRAKITWLDGQSPAQRAFMDFAETLRIALNRELYLGLFAFEANYALYPVGGFYQRHLDSFRGPRNRVISLVAYLNADWDEGDGGALAIYAPDAPADADPVIRIAPCPGDLVLMLSEDIPHAVEPTRRERLAIAAWWRVNESGPDRVSPSS